MVAAGKLSILRSMLCGTIAIDHAEPPKPFKALSRPVSGTLHLLQQALQVVLCVLHMQPCLLIIAVACLAA